MAHFLKQLSFASAELFNMWKTVSTESEATIQPIMTQ